MAGISRLAILLGLAGCSLAPKYVRPPLQVQPNWNEKNDPRLLTQTPVNRDWWRAFNDPTLDRLIQLGYQQNLPLQVSALRILEARAQVGVAVGRQFPQLQEAFASASAIGISKNAADLIGFRSQNFWTFQVGFDAVWELDFWKKYGNGVKAAQATYIGSAADYDDALVSLVAEIAREYAVIRTFETLIELTQGNVTIQQEGQQLAQSRFKNGATSELDVTQATTLLESTRATLPQLQMGLQQAQNALSTLLGRPPGSVQSLLAGNKGIPTAPAQVAVSLPAEMLRRRPDIHSAELRAIAQCARVGIAKADFLPRFSLAGSIGTLASTAGNGSVWDLFNPGTLFYNAGPNIFWPILNYGRITNNVRAEDAKFQESLVDYQNTVLRAQQEVEDATAGFLRSQESVVFEQNAVMAAQQAVKLAFIQYREGAVDYQRVIDAERALFVEQNNLARLRSSVVTNLIALYKALGGGWELRQGEPALPKSTQDEMRDRTNWGDFFSKPPPEPETSNGSR